MADLDIFLKLMAMDDAAFGRRFDGSATGFARLFPDRATTVATNIGRAWRSNSGRNLRDAALAAIDLNASRSAWRRSREASCKPALRRALSISLMIRGYAEECDGRDRTYWRWRTDLVAM